LDEDGTDDEFAQGCLLLADWALVALAAFFAD
jgi:hypothetical protein